MNEPREITESFRLERVLKSSRSAIVFQAADPATGNVVAIKLIPPSAPAQLAACQTRFLATMGAAASLASAGLAPILDYGFTPDGSAFIVMEFIEGIRLDTLAGSPPERILRLVLDVVKNLEALAARGVAHGNLRPDNLLLIHRGAEEGVAILGFGTAAFQAESVGATGLEAAAGTAVFAAPERLDPATAAREPDWRSDLYSLALTTCVLLGAEVAPADAATPTVTLPPEVRQRLRDPVVLRVILEQAQRRSPEARPAALAEFREAIKLALEDVPGRESFMPEIEAEEVIAPTPLPPAPASVGEPSPEVPAEPRKEQTRSVPIARLPEMPAQTPPPGVLPSEPEVLPEAIEFLTPRPGAAPAPVGEPAAAPVELVAEPVELVAEPTPDAPKPGSRWGLAAAAAAVVLITAVAVVIIQSRRSSPPPLLAAAPTPAQRRPTAAPQPVAQPAAVTRLQNAEAAIALSDLIAARQALDTIAQGGLEALPAAERARYATLRAAYDSKVQKTLTRELASSLASGDLKVLAETVRGISKEDEAAFSHNDDLLAALGEARRALDVQALMLKAQRQGDWPEVLQQSTVLVSLVPRYTEAVDLRERAAATLEREADALAGKENFEVALARLETVRRRWPGRNGLAARIAHMKAEQAADQQLASALAAAEQAERDKLPEKGLAVLAAASPPPRWQDRVRQVRERLTTQLQQLDAAPPTVALVPGVKLEYKKNEPGTIALRIQDDHGIKSARLFARLEGSVPYFELPLRRGAAGEYVAEVSPAFHQNTTVEFYIVASDSSDHTTQLGSAQAPLTFKRKKWSLFGR